MPVVRDYQKLSEKQQFSYYGLEGYIMARTLVEGLKRAGKDLTREKLIVSQAKLKRDEGRAAGLRIAIEAYCEAVGIALDETANAANALKISRNDSRIGVFVIPTDEEQVIADEGWSALAKI